MVDQKFYKQNNLLVGCDEVGRGPLAGPVVGAAVCFAGNLDVLLKLAELGITDSKKLTSKKRQAILHSLSISIADISPMKKLVIKNSKNIYLSCMVIQKSPEYIDKYNILQSSLHCMEEGCVNLIKDNRAVVLVDGNKLFKQYDHIEQYAIVKGDAKSLVIGLASIIAKEYRDKLMEQYDHIYPQYGFAKHAGYPTKMHKEALKQYGPTPIHRRSFKGVKELLDRE